MTAQTGNGVTIVTLDGRLVAPETPLLHADDLAALRGDGVFETLLVRDGAACLVDAHLRRLARSAELMELRAPDLPAWRCAIETAVRQWTSDNTGEGALRLIYSRGRESGTSATAYAMITALPERIAGARRDGVAAVTLNRALPALGGGADETMPWLLAGAKTLSYAINMAALRHAAGLGADDVIFVSSDGYILEGPRSTVVIATGNRCLITPPATHRILCGTTQQALFDVASAKGYSCRYQSLRQADLIAAQDIWLVSSITLAARVHTLDGRVLPPSRLNAEFAALIDAAVAGDR